MLEATLSDVFVNAALPQRAALIVLSAAIPAIPVAAVLSRRRGASAALWRRGVADLRVAGPALGLLVAGLNSFHMAETIQRLPFDPTLKQLAPGLLEVSAFVSLGALVGLVAVAAHALLGCMAPGTRAL